jgi:hypothetical protein
MTRDSFAIPNCLTVKETNRENFNEVAHLILVSYADSVSQII